MKEKPVPSSVTDSPHWKLGARNFGPSPDEELAFDYRELQDVCSFIDDDDLVEIVKATDPPTPFSGFGSYRQRHGAVLTNARSFGGRNTKRGGSSRLSAEAPAKLSYIGLGMEQSELQNIDRKEQQHSSAQPVPPSCPIDIRREYPISSDSKVRTRRLQKQRSFSSTDIDRDEAWERKRGLFSMDGSHCDGSAGRKTRTVARSVSDCGEGTWARPNAERSRLKSRTRSLTDEDLEELRGCIDLGFGFSYDESCDLRKTLPALELYYAINRQHDEIKSRSSPISPLDGITVSLSRASSGGSLGSPLSDSWRISSLGDHPTQVKTRLRHWAQAVACSVKQGFSL